MCVFCSRSFHGMKYSALYSTHQIQQIFLFRQSNPYDATVKNICSFFFSQINDRIH